MLSTATFDGATFDQQRDGARLTSQLERVRTFMGDGRWRTLAEIADAIGGTEPSASARLRDLRKDKFGGYQVERAYVENGLWQYRVLAPPTPGQMALFGELP